MIKRVCIFALVIGILVAVLSTQVCAEEAKILDTTVAKFHDAAKGWEPVLKHYAKRLFLILCVISLVFTAGWGFLRGNMGLGDFFVEFVKFGVTMGFYFWLLENGPEMAKSLINSMTVMGQEASSDYVARLTPSDICTQGFSLLYDAIAEFGKSGYSTGVMVIVIAFCIALVFGVIAAQMIVLLCSAWILIYGGVFYLGFGGSNWTSDIAKNYFKTVLAQAMQIFTFCLLIGIGQREIKALTVGLRSTKGVTVANYWWMLGFGEGPTKVVSSESLTLSAMCVCLVFAVVLVILVDRVPGLIAGIITGSSITAMAFGGMGGAVNSAMGMAAGGAMIMSQVAGAGVALNSAYQQSRENMDMGMGRFSSAAAGGLAGVMSGGMNFACDMAANLISGGINTAKDNLQNTTTGGKVSAMIEANGEASRAAVTDSTEGKGGDTSAKANDGAMGETVAAEANSGESPGVADGSSGDGVQSVSTGDSPSIDDAENSVAYDAVDDGGFIASGNDDDIFGSEFEDYITNYDPKKAGLPDES